MVQNRKEIWQKLLLLVIIPLLLVIYTDNYTFVDWQWDSQDLVYARMYQIQEGFPSEKGFLGNYYLDDEWAGGRQLISGEYVLEDAEKDRLEYRTYSHQTGIQADVLGAINRVAYDLGLPGPVRMAIIHGPIAFLFFAMGGYILHWMMRRFGTWAGALVLFSPWLWKCAGNVYWVPWTFLFPMVCTIKICDLLEEGEKVHWKWWLLFAVSVLIRCLCGFEFISTIMIAFEVPVIYCALRADPEQRRRFIRTFFVLAVIALLMFALAFGLWIMQNAMYQGSVQGALEDIYKTIDIRTGVGGAEQLRDEEFQKALNMPWRELLGTYLSDPMVGPFSVKVITKLYIAASVLWLVHQFRKKGGIGRQEIAEWGAVAAAYLAPLSWFVLARGHAAVHFHLDFILWLFPTLSIVFAHLAKILSRLLREKEHERTL